MCASGSGYCLQEATYVTVRMQRLTLNKWSHAKLTCFSQRLAIFKCNQTSRLEGRGSLAPAAVVSGFRGDYVRVMFA